MWTAAKDTHCRSSRSAKESIVVQVEQLHELSTKSHMVGPETSGVQATNISSNVIYHDIQWDGANDKAIMDSTEPIYKVLEVSQSSPAWKGMQNVAMTAKGSGTRPRKGATF